jgi:replicative DNA helicase
MADISKLLEKYRKIKPDTFYRFDEITSQYGEYAKFINKNKIYFGFETLDEMLKGIRPGEVCYIIASTNVGKSQLAFHIIDHNKNKDICIPFFSLENNKFQVFERIIQVRTGCTTFEIENNYANDDKEFIQKCERITSEYKNIMNIIDRISLDNLIPYIKASEEISQKKAGVVIIDYAQLIKNVKSNEYERLSEISQVIKSEVALKLNLPVICLSQVSRGESRSKEGLNIHSAKGSGEIENSAQILLSIEKLKSLETSFDADVEEKFIEKKIDILKLKILKKKRGSFGEIYLISDRESLRLTEYHKRPEIKTI